LVSDNMLLGISYVLYTYFCYLVSIPSNQQYQLEQIYRYPFKFA